MNNERYNQIIDEAYKNYCKWVDSENKKGSDAANNLRRKGILVKQYYVSKLSQEEFINKIKTDSEFSERWGLKIEERELSLDERKILWVKKVEPSESACEYVDDLSIADTHDIFNQDNVPTKLLTITYKDKTVEVYE